MPLTTKLSAVNTMLSVVGETKISSLDSGDPDADLAVDVLDEINMEFQSIGWKFNEESRTLMADQTGTVYVPANTLKFDSKNYQDASLILRGNRLYDTQSNSYQVGRNVSCVVTILLDFEEIPQPAKRYIEIRAARVFQKRTLGAPDLDAFTQDDENRAWITFLDYVGDTHEYNIFKNPEMAEAVDRRIHGGTSWLS